MKYWLITCSVITQIGLISCLLYPYETETREVKSLDGLWNFKISPENDMDAGFKEEWFKRDLSKDVDSIKMPVPSSYNDVTTNATIRDYVGWVWYQRTLHVPSRWLENDSRIVLHFGSVHYHAIIYVGEHKIGEHEGGHLPFQLELPHSAVGRINRLTVAVNNTLTPDTVPQGRLYYPNNTMRYPKGYKLYTHAFDYFDYAGINRPVFMFITNKIYIKDIHVSTDVDKGVGYVKYSLKLSDPSAKCVVRLYDYKDEQDHVVADANSCNGEMKVSNAQLWWPAGLCDKTPGHLYMFEIQVFAGEGSSLVDSYSMSVGIRKVSWTNKTLLINNQPVYLTGFGMHEDADIRGRGFDYATMTRDMNLIKWLGANSFRTSHYPYAEETIFEADAQGIMVILEAPACSLSGFGDKLYKRHKDYVHEMVAVFKNHPSVIMWSLANEPVSNSEQANYYFGNLSAAAKELDSTRPITFVGSQLLENETAIQHVDIIGVNRYRGWYTDSGLTDLISYQVENEMTAWHEKYNKPVIVTEYGAGAVSGLHTLPEAMWSEDYQAVTHQKHFLAFDKLRQEGKIAGEMMWNFIDFNTPQEYFRPGRCSKGLFTRERQPKQVAHVVRERYTSLAKCPSD
ncbi:beta-glucuronidase-like [Macrosteles quadrilineatus]|uniref:beta-glucuronidase-like n=1 Tax=Macrosteles quadrilineatus TaxID=74068 RepID=UPI0023E11D87|nr:beta-glucuronidase-like [Macrosteles quadrilineatus]XP_054273719.1 beta-glucuronidase-like [Macrosteles quadrilineatus]XP_054273727.1 beta-glucuronidase-like [Macrosteles quadrilineatus]